MKRKTTEAEPQVDKNIPVPVRGTGYRRLLDRMNPGDSTQLSARGANSFSVMARRNGAIVVRRMQPDGNFRVWIVEKGTNQRG